MSQLNAHPKFWHLWPLHKSYVWRTQAPHTTPVFPVLRIQSAWIPTAQLPDSQGDTSLSHQQFVIAFGTSTLQICCGVSSVQTTWWEGSQYGVIPWWDLSSIPSSNLTNSWGLHLGHWAICLKHSTGVPVVQTMWRSVLIKLYKK